MRSVPSWMSAVRSDQTNRPGVWSSFISGNCGRMKPASRPGTRYALPNCSRSAASRKSATPRAIGGLASPSASLTRRGRSNDHAYVVGQVQGLATLFSADSLFALVVENADENAVLETARHELRKREKPK